jgi:hypothetical protein
MSTNIIKKFLCEHLTAIGGGDMIMTMKSVVLKRVAICISKMILITISALLIMSCTALNNWGTTTPPIVRVRVVNSQAVTSMGILAAIYFSVVNETDRALYDLTLEVSVSPKNGVDVPFTKIAIDKIVPNGSWRPETTFVVRGRSSGTTIVYFIVKRDGKVLAKNYCLVSIPHENRFRRPLRGF